MSHKIQPFKKRRRYYNSEVQRPESLLFGTLPSFLKSLWHKRGPKFRQPTHHWVYQSPEVVPISHEPRITWIGHSTFLIQVAGFNIITDPIFTAPSYLFPRLLPPGIALEKLPPIDLVVISHNHRDHTDLWSLRQLKAKNRRIKILVAYGDRDWFWRKGLGDVHEHEWWQEREVGFWRQEGLYHTVRCTFLPAWHWSQRGLFDKNKSLWGSWMIQADKYSIYFAGDTAYSPHFTAIAHHFPDIHVALMPIGPCEPDEWMRHTHLNSTQAVQAFIDLKARHFFPMHWGTFGFGNDHFDLPVERLEYAWDQVAYDMLFDKKLHLPKAGQHIVCV